jgi:hypothetical protein
MMAKDMHALMDPRDALSGAHSPHHAIPRHR